MHKITTIPESPSALIVENDPEVLKVLGMMLDEMGFQTTMVATGEAALPFLEGQDDFTILITGYDMTGITGANLIANAVALRPDLPCLLVTGMMGENLPICAAQILRKPFSFATLAAMLHTQTGFPLPGHC